jgi:putative FmdB family regulatory protein
MPIYDYACTDCGRVVEVVHGVNGHGPQACATCGGPMRKLLSTPAVHFKGSGWAKKDRGASNRTKSAARSGSSDEGSRSGADEARASDSDSTSDRGSQSGRDEASRSGAEGGGRSRGDQVKSRAAASESAKKEPTGAPASSGAESA